MAFRSLVNSFCGHNNDSFCYIKSRNVLVALITIILFKDKRHLPTHNPHPSARTLKLVHRIYVSSQLIHCCAAP